MSWGTAKGTMLRSIKPFQLAERQLDATWHKEREQCVSGERRRDATSSLGFEGHAVTSLSMLML